MSYHEHHKILLDKDYSKLSLTEKNDYLLQIIDGLRNNVSLDDESNNARESFSSYKWVSRNNADKDEFGRLQAMGNNHEMTECDIDDFMELVSCNGEHHPYYFVRKAHDVFSGDSGLTSGDDICGGNILADFEIQDPRVVEDVELRKEDADTYRFTIEQSKNTKQIYFKVHSKALCSLDREITLNGLAGVVEIRNGKPGISLGVHEEDLPIHIESDVHSGLSVHTDSDASPITTNFYSSTYGMAFPALYYPCDTSPWLEEVRSKIAEIEFAQYVFPDKMVVIETSGWETAGNYRKQPCFFENPKGGDSISGYFEINFYDSSTIVSSVSSG